MVDCFLVYSRNHVSGSFFLGIPHCRCYLLSCGCYPRDWDLVGVLLGMNIWSKPKFCEYCKLVEYEHGGFSRWNCCYKAQDGKKYCKIHQKVVDKGFATAERGEE